MKHTKLNVANTKDPVRAEYPSEAVYVGIYNATGK
jgi:hypothetical protein